MPTAILDSNFVDPSEALRTSEESYRTIFDLAGDAMFVHDIETGAILDANIKACELHGCSLDELKSLGVGGISVGEPPYDMFHARRYIQLAAAGLPQRFEWLVRHHTGNRFWVEVSLNRARLLGAERIIASVRNIDDRKKAADALRAAHDELEERVRQRTADLECRTRDLEQAEQRFRAIVEASPTPLLLSRLEDGRILFANERLEMLLGAESGSLTGRRTVDFYHDPAERDKVVDLLREHGSVRDLELRIRKVDGTARWVSASVQRFVYNGELALATSLLDITERKRSEEILTFQKTLLEAQSDSLIDGMLVVSSDRRILSFNKRFIDMFGLSSEVLETGSDEAALANALDKIQDPNAFLERIAYLYGNPDERASDEVVMVDGRILDRYSAPVVSKDGHRYGRIWFFRDVTDERRYERELMAARLEADAAREQASRYAKSLHKEIETGRNIQMGFLPSELPHPDGWEADVRFKPAWQVAGDFYDMFYAAPGLLGIVVVDVCGKGVGAALFMALFQSLLRTSAERVGSNLPECDNPEVAILQESLKSTNDYVKRVHRPSRIFASLFFALLNEETGDVTYVNAGHEPPLLVGARRLRRLKPTGPAVGVLSGVTFGVQRVRMHPGDLLFAYTDGVTDARNRAGEFFGLDRLISRVGGSSRSPEAVLNEIDDAISDFCGTAPLSDDVTMLAVRRLIAA